MINQQQPVLIGNQFTPVWFKFFAIIDAFIAASTSTTPPSATLQAQIDSLNVDLGGERGPKVLAATDKADATETLVGALPLVSPFDYARLDGFDVRLESVVYGAPGPWATVAQVSAATAPQGGASRPSPPTLFQTFFDTGLGQPIWCKQVSPAIWVNAAGVQV